MALLKEVPKRRLLRTWKEIAAYLGVTVRSVERWEKQAGLPVYRQNGGRKARVYAYSDELHHWLEQGGMERGLEAGAAADTPEPATAASDTDPDTTTGTSVSPLRRWFWLHAAGMGLAALGLAAVVCWQTGIWPARVPHSWRFAGGDLLIEDAHHRLCWEKHLPPFDSAYDGETPDKVLIADINGDGQQEVLVNSTPSDLAEKGGSLLCFDHRGRSLWQHHYGEPKTFGTRSFAPTYRGTLLRPVVVAGQHRLLTVANHFIWYPSQVALLDPANGKVVEEYWHPGAIYYCILHDLDHDGQPEALLGAINNPGDGPGHAAVAVLKLPFSAGPRHTMAIDSPFPPLTGGGEVAYRLFPFPDTSRVAGLLPFLAHVAVDPYERILVETIAPESSAVVYYLDFQLHTLEYRLSDNFAAVHDRYQKLHLLDHALNPAESALLGKVEPFSAAPDGNSPKLRQFWPF